MFSIKKKEQEQAVENPETIMKENFPKKEFEKLCKTYCYSEVKKKVYQKLNTIKSDSIQSREEKLYNLLWYCKENLSDCKQIESVIHCMYIPIVAVIISMEIEAIRNLNVINILLCMVPIWVVIMIVRKLDMHSQKKYYTFYINVTNEYIQNKVK